MFEATDVEYNYQDGTPALSQVSFGIPRGSKLAILGANGSGKSTLLRILNGLLFPSAGAVLFRGTALTESSLKAPEFRKVFRQSVGFVFQNADAQLFNATTAEEISYGPRQMGLDEREVATRTQDVMGFLGIAHLAERPPFRLSGGEKRKVAIASVLSMNPEVLMFDEPFLGLDPRSQSWLIRTLEQLQRSGKTTVIATHTLDTVPRIAEQVMVLDEDHNLVAHGPACELLRDTALLRSANLIDAEVGNRYAIEPRNDVKNELAGSIQ